MSQMTDTRTPPSIEPYDRELVPRALIRAVAVLVLTVLALVTYYKLSDGPLIATPPAGKIVSSRQVLISGDTAGAATIRNLDGTLIADLTAQHGGFISGVWRVILSVRELKRVPLDAPVTIIGRDTGRISILDPSTGWSADLMGFGKDNARAFAQLLVQPKGDN